MPMLTRWRGAVLFAMLAGIAPFELRADFAAAMTAYGNKDYSVAQVGFLEMAALGHGASQFKLAAMALQGHGMAKDPAIALGWLTAAASNGYAVDAAQAATLREHSRDRARGR